MALTASYTLGMEGVLWSCGVCFCAEDSDAALNIGTIIAI
jgi:hypothetical protein